MPVVYFPLWENSSLLLANDIFAFQVSETCNAVLIIQYALLKLNGEGMKTVIGHLQCLIFYIGIGINNFLFKDVGI